MRNNVYECTLLHCKCNTMHMNATRWSRRVLAKLTSAAPGLSACHHNTMQLVTNAHKCICKQMYHPAYMCINMH